MLVVFSNANCATILGSTMSVWTTSLVSTQEVVNMLLDKYRVECPASNFSIFLVKDNGGIVIVNMHLVKSSDILYSTTNRIKNRAPKSAGGRISSAITGDAGSGRERSQVVSRRARGGR